MSIPTFNGQRIFGAQTKQSGPFTDYRMQREIIPGVAGSRIYRMGRNSLTWRIRGRLTYRTRGTLETNILAALQLLNGQTYTFLSAAGNIYANCVLTSYTPIGEPRVVESDVSYYTQEIDATVECIAPTL